MNLAQMSAVRFNGVSRGRSSTTTTLSMSQLSQLSGVDALQLDSLMGYGVLATTAQEHESATFDIGCVMTLQRAQRLRLDLALDEHAFALAVMLLHQVSDLEEEVRIVRTEARRYLAEPSSKPSGAIGTAYAQRSARAAFLAGSTGVATSAEESRDKSPSHREPQPRRDRERST